MSRKLLSGSTKGDDEYGTNQNPELNLRKDGIDLGETEIRPGFRPCFRFGISLTRQCVVLEPQFAGLLVGYPVRNYDCLRISVMSVSVERNLFVGLTAVSGEACLSSVSVFRRGMWQTRTQNEQFRITL
jgi:hypothetical protein